MGDLHLLGSCDITGHVTIDLFCDVTDVTHEYSVEAKELGGNGWCGIRRS